MTEQTQDLPFTFKVVEFLKNAIIPIIVAVLTFAIPHITGVAPLVSGEYSILFVYFLLPIIFVLVFLFLFVRDYFPGLVFLMGVRSVLFYYFALVAISLTGEWYIITKNADVYYNNTTQEIVQYEPNQVVFVSQDIKKIHAYARSSNNYKDVSQNVTHFVGGHFEIENSKFIEDNFSKWSEDALSRAFGGAVLSYYGSSAHDRNVSDLFCQTMANQGFDITHCRITIFQQRVETTYHK